MAGSFYVGGFAPKKPTPNQLLPYCKRISANVKHPSVSYTYAFYSTKKPLPIAGAKARTLYVNLKCTHSRKLGALYQFMVRKPVREYANDYLYISENIFVQTEPHIHPGCHFPYFSSNVNPVNSTYHLSTLSTQHP